MSNLVNNIRRKIALTSAVPTTLLSGITSYYKLDETSGTVANDSVGSINGTLNEGSFISSGKINYGWNIPNQDGSYGIRFGTGNFCYNWSQPVTFNMWINFAALDGTTKFFLSNENVDGTEIGYYLSMNPIGDSRINFAYKNTNTFSAFIRTTGIPITTTGIWYMLTFTNDGSGNASGLNIYVNAVKPSQEIISNNLGGRSTVSTTQLSLGARSITGGIWGPTATFDELGIWTRELSTDEITELYNSGTGIQYPF